MKQVKSIVLDINKKYYGTIETKDKDTARYLLFKLLDDGVPFDLTGKKVRAYSSYEKFNDLVTVDAKNGLCELKLTTEFLGKAGFNKVELTIYEGLETLSTMLFCINNIACLRDDSAIESTNEFSALTIALNKVEQLEKNLEEASTDLEKKYTDRLNGIESTIKDNKLTDLETDANLTKLNSVVEGNVIIDRIQGRTLVNLIKPTIVGKSGTIYTVKITGVLDTKNRTITYCNNTSRDTIINIYENSLWKREHVVPSNTVKTITTTGNEEIGYIIGLENKGWTEANKNDLLKVMMLDGVYTGSTPSYFEGLKSVGEDNSNKIEISTPIQLHPSKTVIPNSNIVDVEFSNIYNVKVGDILKYGSGTNQSVIWRHNVRVLGVNNNILTLHTETTVNGSISINDIFWHKADKSEISLAEPLRGVLNIYDYVTSKGNVNRNLKQILVNDSTCNFRLNTSTQNIDYLVVETKTTKVNASNNAILEGFVVSYATGDEISNINKYWVNTNNIVVGITKGTSLEQAKALVLNKNLVYQIATIIEPLNSSLILTAFKDGYFGVNAGAINPNVSLRFPTNFSGRVKTLEESNIELKNNYYESLKVQLQLLAKSVELETGKLNSSDLLGKIYPVGCVFTSTNGTNPGIYLGGTWVKFAEGKTLIGDSSTDSDFHAGKTGGEKEHTLINKEMPSHAHNINGCFDAGSGSTGYAECVPFGATSTPKNNDIITLDTGGGQPHNNLPPYIAVYMWTRTA